MGKQERLELGNLKKSIFLYLFLHFSIQLIKLSMITEEECIRPKDLHMFSNFLLSYSFKLQIMSFEIHLP